MRLYTEVVNPRNIDAADSDGSGDEPPRSDRSLLRGVHSGEEEAAQELFDRYIDRLRLLANRQLATSISARVDSEDVTQSIFRTLFRRLRDGQYSVPEGDSIWQLLVTISLNKIRSIGTYHRAAKRDIRRNKETDHGQLVDYSPANDETAVHILRMTIQELVCDLSPSQQNMIEMRMEGHDVIAIASATGRSKRTVERTLQGFRTRLKRVIDEGHSDEHGDA